MNVTEALADCLDWYAERMDQYRSDDESNERCRHLMAETRPQPQHQQRTQRYRDGIRIDGVQPSSIEADPLNELGGSAGELEAQHVTKLLNDQDRGDPRREAGDNRKGYELDGSAQSPKAERDEYQTCHHGRDSQPIYTIPLDDPVYDDNEGAGGSSYLY